MFVKHTKINIYKYNIYRLKYIYQTPEYSVTVEV